MITIKLFGGAKKSFAVDTITVTENNLTIKQLLNNILNDKPENTPELDINNILVAVNGIDSSALEGKDTKLSSGDTISIIPIIHGGAAKRIILNLLKPNTELIGIKDDKLDRDFLNNLRQKFPELRIQSVSLKFLLGKSHAQKIINISLTAEKNQILLSKKLETDILMRFACTYQISKAIKSVGITSQKNFLVIAIGRKTSLDKLYNFFKTNA